jgi:hypothetical protein
MQVRVVWTGRPTKLVLLETYDEPSDPESTEAWLLPQAPRCLRPAKYVDVIGDEPQPHESGTWSWTPS